MRHRLPIILILAAVLTAGVVAKRADLLPGRDASSIVRRAQEQGMLHSYSAVGQTRIACQGRPVLSDVRLTNMPPNKCRIEYTSEPLKGVVIGNDGKNNWRYDPKTERLAVSTNRSCGGAAGKLHLLLDNHRVALAGNDRIAGREAYSLVVRPKDSTKIMKRLWVDTRTFVILRQEDYNSHGKLQSSTRFDSIRFAKGFPDRLFRMPTDVKITTTHRTLGDPMPLDKLSEALGFGVRVPKHVPAGYKLDAYRRYACPCNCPHESAYIRYTNGLSSISVFESKAGSGCRIEAGCGKSAGPMGTCEIRRADRGEVVSVTRNGVSFVVVADLDSKELRKIADSLR